MNKEFFEALELLEKEKGIPKEYMIGKVEAALITAFKRERGGSNVRIVIDEHKKEVRVYEQMTVVEEVTDPMTEITLEEGEYFVLGDNRPISHDSHSHDVGPVSRIEGKVRFVLWPFDRFGAAG
jgi:hypothetical protein